MTLKETLDKFRSFRIFVSDDEGRRRSAIWFVRHVSGSVYVAPRNIGTTYKLSLHPFRSGRDGRDSQVGMKNEAADAERLAGFTIPKPIRWARKETPATGVLPIARILFPTDFLNACDPPEDDGKLKFSFPLAPPGGALEAVICYSRESPKALEDRFRSNGFTQFGMMSLPSDEFVHLVLRNVTCDNVAIGEAVAKFGHGLPLSGAPQPGERIENARAVIVAGQPEHGEMLTLIDVGTFAVERETGAEQANDR